MSDFMTAAAYRAHLKGKKQPKGRRSGNGDAAKAEMEMILKLSGLDYVTEKLFHPERKWRFDFAIESLKVAIEYEGVVSDKSRHTTIGGFMEDCLKYREAAILGWKLLRYTAKDYKRLATDLARVTGVIIPDRIDCKQLKHKANEKV